MKKTATQWIGGLTLLVMLAVSACTKEDAPPADEKVPWANYVTGIIEEYYRRNPESAVDAGKHEYDGQASDLSLEAAREYIEWLNRVIDEASSYEDLNGIAAFERDYLVQAMRGSVQVVESLKGRATIMVRLPPTADHRVAENRSGVVTQPS